MDQEICLILGQVSLSLHYKVRNLQKDFLWFGEETDKTAGDIQTRPCMARTLERNVKER